MSEQTPKPPSPESLFRLEGKPPIGRAILERMNAVEGELRERHGPDYSLVDYYIRSSNLAAKDTALLLGLFCIAIPEAVIYAFAEGVKQLLHYPPGNEGFIRLF